MGEPSSCVVKQEYSCAAETIDGEREAHPVCAFGGSISFGRYMSESLDWGRWSSFRHNRYLEEVEKYSTPGVVAQKKAYFEAHYKRIAAKKLAASVAEQENVLPNTDFNMENSNEEPAARVSFEMESISNVQCNTITEESRVEFVMHEEKVLEMPAIDKLEAETNSLDRIREKDVVLVMERESLEEFNSQVASSEVLEAVENESNGPIVQFSRISPTSKTPLKESFFNNQEKTDSVEQKPRVSASRSAVRRSSRWPPLSASKLPPSPAKLASLMNCTKENKPAPSNCKHGAGSCDKKRSTLKSLHMLINLTQDRREVTPIHVTKTLSVREKIQRLEVASNNLKASKGSLQTFRTPTRVPPTRTSKVPSANPESEKRRTNTPTECNHSGRKKVQSYVHTISVDHSNPSRTTVSRAQPHIVSSPFRFRTDERAEKRKECFLYLEDRLNAKEAKKAQLQEETKEKAEHGLRKLPQSSCFKARPMPSFYKVTESKCEKKKISFTKPQSPNSGRRSTPTRIFDSKFLTLTKPSLKTEKSKHSAEKNSQTSRHSSTSITK